MSFNIVFSDQDMPNTVLKSVFLAGPSPRTQDIQDWRHEALSLFEKNNFTGTIFIPVPQKRFYGEEDSSDWTYDNQVQWECDGRNFADQIFFWIPRDIKNGMPAFTTNIEFGEDLASGKIIYGRPEEAEKCRYLDKRINNINEIVHSDLNQLIVQSISELGEGSYRENGEVYVPLLVWKSNHFQSWYRQLKENGNKLHHAKLLNHFKNNNKKLISFSLFVSVWLEKEQNLINDCVVFSVPDSISIVPFFKKDNHIFIVMVKKFNINTRNESGFVYELPNGNSYDNTSKPNENARNDLKQQTDIFIEDTNRFQFIINKQICVNLSSAHSFVFNIELTKEEFTSIENLNIKNNNTKFSIEMISLNDIMNYPVDFSMIGIIVSAFKEQMFCK